YYLGKSDALGLAGALLPIVNMCENRRPAAWLYLLQPSCVWKGALGEFKHFKCSAKISGAKICSTPDAGHYVMWLDIPQDDD
ncbi:hypothetical protein, partial [Acinetobacter baumannii]|uniref:hypothetical protein n=1 Tax=Acinetobacter baumannii TaxID=470 RepID=UPI0028A1DCA2